MSERDTYAYRYRIAYVRASKTFEVNYNELKAAFHMPKAKITDLNMRKAVNLARKIVKFYEEKHTQITVTTDENSIEEPVNETRPKPQHRHYLTPYERVRMQVYATGNRWAIENFNLTH